MLLGTQLGAAAHTMQSLGQNLWQNRPHLRPIVQADEMTDEELERELEEAQRKLDEIKKRKEEEEKEAAKEKAIQDALEKLKKEEEEEQKRIEEERRKKAEEEAKKHEDEIYKEALRRKEEEDQAKRQQAIKEEEERREKERQEQKQEEQKKREQQIEEEKKEEERRKNQEIIEERERQKLLDEQKKQLEEEAERQRRENESYIEQLEDYIRDLEHEIANKPSEWEYDWEENEEEIGWGVDDFDWDWEEIEENPMNIFDVLFRMRWYLNFFFIGIPWVLYIFCANIWNLYFNAELNRDWAEGNVYLIFNTLFSFWQGFNSIGLVLEFPYWLRTTKKIRTMNLIIAVFYNIVFMNYYEKWYRELYLATHDEQKEFGPIDLIVEMFLGYNLVLHLPIAIMNVAIILKEFSLEYVQLLSARTGSQRANYNYALGHADANEGLRDIFWIINPFTWIDIWFVFLFGWKAEDVFIENPDDEDHYYENWM